MEEQIGVLQILSPFNRNQPEASQLELAIPHISYILSMPSLIGFSLLHVEWAMHGRRSVSSFNHFTFHLKSNSS